MSLLLLLVLGGGALVLLGGRKDATTTPGTAPSSPTGTPPAAELPQVTPPGSGPARNTPPELAPIAAALRLGDAYSSWKQGLQASNETKLPWLWLIPIARVWQTIATAMGAPAFAPSAADFRRDIPASVAAWSSFVARYAADLGVGQAASKDDDATLMARFASSAFDALGVPSGDWEALRSVLGTAVAAASRGTADPVPSEWLAWGQGSSEKWTLTTEQVRDQVQAADGGPYGDPAWDLRQSWAAVGALCLMAHDVQAGTPPAEQPHAPKARADVRQTPRRRT